jgi:hypothetical protein
LPDFALPFVVECDASSTGIGTVLHQGSGAVAFFSRALAPRHRTLAAYEHELIGLSQAVRHWHPYLWGHTFLVRTDHQPLKYILDQRLETIPQLHWVSKLLGFDFSVEYKPGHTNVVADTLPRCTEDTAALSAISTPSFSIIDEYRHLAVDDAELRRLTVEIQAGSKGEPWALIDGLVTFKRRLFVPSSFELIPAILVAAHDDGHEGTQKTLHRLVGIFTSPMHGLQYRPMSAPAWCVNATKSRPYILQVFFSHCQCLLQFGVRSAWTSSKAYPRSVARRSS